MRCWTCFSVSCHCSTPNFRRGPTILVGPPSLSKNYCFPILCRVSEAGVGADASVCPMSSREFSQYSVGADAYIGPPGSCEFAADYRKKRCNLPGRCGHRPLHRNGQCMRMCRSFSQNQLHSAGRTEASTHTKQNDIDRDRTFLTR